ncbi:MAG: nitrilase-related carbon-nitrogen hydrolase [Gemmobacter sp.]
MRIAIWQGPSPAGDEGAAFAALGQALAAAAAGGAGILVAPEVFLPGYNCADIAALAQPRGGPWHRRLAGMARAAGCGLVAGYAERDGARVFNAAVAFDAAGAEVAHYRKIQLYGARERALYAPGDQYAVFDLGGVRAALLICYDVEFAPHLRRLAEAGVGLLLVPTANMMPYLHVGRAVVPAHAINHRMTIVYANYCGAEGDLTYCGGSLIAAPDGEVLAMAGPAPALLIADAGRAPDPAMMQTQLEDYRDARMPDAQG